MDTNNGFRLSQSSRSLRMLITCYILTLTLGYAVAHLKIFDATEMKPSKILTHYRGAESGEDVGLVLPPSFATLLSVSHVHSLSQPMMLMLLGLPFVFSNLSEKKKSFLISLSFLSSVVSNAAPWLVRYSSPWTAVLLPLSQAGFMIGFFGMAGVSLKDLWCSCKES